MNMKPTPSIAIDLCHLSAGALVAGDARGQFTPVDVLARTQLGRSAGRWTSVAQPTLLASDDRAPPGEPSAFLMDGWDGYAVARSRLLHAVERQRAGATTVVSDEVHAFSAAALRSAPRGAVLATQFVVGAITSEGPSENTITRLLANNPHLRYGRAYRGGYAVVELASDSIRVAFRAGVYTA